jgi:glutamyl-tRNA reductase
MKLLVVGCSYRSAPVAVRERLAFAADAIPGALGDLRALPEVREALLVSTCNRVEVYAAVSDPATAAERVRDLLARSRGMPREALDEVLYEHADTAAARHIFSVTASLDAMVVGEAQIAGQVKDAYAAASQSQTLGPLLSRCMHRAFATAKRVRNETEIARHPVSVSSVAAELAARVFGDLAQSTVLVVGAGEMAELAVRHLVSDGAADIRVVNRTFERAVQLAFDLGAKAARWENLRGQLLLADIVISSTGSEQPIISRKLISEVMRERKQRPLFLVDIAVPRDIEKDVGQLPNVYLFDVDDLEQVVAENLKERRKEVHQAERIVEEEVQHFQDWLRKQRAVPVVKVLRERFSEVVRAEAEQAAQALRLQNGEQRRLLEAMANAIVNKLLHAPTVELKRRANTPEGDALAEAVRELFELREREAPFEAAPLPEDDAPAAADAAAGAKAGAKHEG